MAKNGKISRDIHAAREALGAGSRQEAFQIYCRIVEEEELDYSLHTELGHLCIDLEEFERAVGHYRVALDENPDSPSQMAHLGIGLENFGEPDEAREVLGEALEKDDTMFLAQNVLGVLYMRRSQYESALPHLERADELRPGHPVIEANLASTLAELNQYERGLAYAKKAIKSKDAGENTYFILGRLLSQLGRNDEAVRYFEQAIKKHKTFGSAYFTLASLKKFSGKDKPFIRKVEKVLDKSMPARDRKAIHFALGKMYDDCKEYDQAFYHYQKGNTLHKNILASVKSEKKKAKSFMKAFSRNYLKQTSEGGSSSEKPVFVVGMPRSGTTLIEQMIASHSEAAGAGELPEIPRIASSLVPEGESRSVNKLRAALTSEARQEYAEGYLEILEQGRHEASRIVDKMPANFMFLGLIHWLFPNATIIHAIRHPLDICISCYAQQFKFLEWSTEFSSIAQMYRLYRESMAYWRKVLPEGTIVDLSYEKLVANPEGEGERLLQACGLSWDDNVLRFYEQESAVKTASLAQVRQPIYGSSRQRWARYAPYIGELATALAPYLPESRQELESQGVPLGHSFDLRRRLGRAF